MNTTIFLLSHSVLTTPPPGRVFCLSRSFVNVALTHFVLDSRPFAPKRRVDLSATAGWTIERPVIIVHSK
jgi:hypothetical protein